MSNITVGRFAEGVGDEVGLDGEFLPAFLRNLAKQGDRSPELSQSSIRFCTVPDSSRVKSN